jgi:hypothetical protein
MTEYFHLIKNPNQDKSIFKMKEIYLHLTSKYFKLNEDFFKFFWTSFP